MVRPAPAGGRQTGFIQTKMRNEIQNLVDEIRQAHQPAEEASLTGIGAEAVSTS